MRSFPSAGFGPGTGSIALANMRAFDCRTGEHLEPKRTIRKSARTKIETSTLGVFGDSDPLAFSFAIAKPAAVGIGFEGRL